MEMRTWYTFLSPFDPPTLSRAYLFTLVVHITSTTAQIAFIRLISLSDLEALTVSEATTTAVGVFGGKALLREGPCR